MKNKVSPSKNSQKEHVETKPDSAKTRKILPTKYGSLLLWILVLGGLLVAGYFALRIAGEEVGLLEIVPKEEMVPSSEKENSKTELSDKERLDNVENQLKNLTEKVEKYAASEKEFVSVLTEIAALNARLNILEARVAGGAIIEGTAIGVMEETFNDKEKKNGLALKKIEARLATLENSLHIREELGQNGFAVLTTFAALQNAVLSGHIYREQLKAFKEQYPFKDEVFQEAIKALEPYNEEGLVTPTQLFLSFPNLADEIYKANRAAPKTTWEEVKNKILDLVSVRPIAFTDTSEESLPSYLFQMETFLSRGDVGQAIDIYTKLPSSIQEVGLSWVDSAKAYMKAEQAIRKLEALVFWRALGRVPIATEKETSLEKENTVKEK